MEELMLPLQLSHYTLTTALGRGVNANLAALQQQRSGLQACQFQDIELNTFIGKVIGVEDVQLPDALQEYTCRNHQLALLALQQDDFMSAVTTLKSTYESERIAVVMGTTTTGIFSAEQAFKHHHATGKLPPQFNYQQTAHPGSLSDFVADCLDLHGVRYTIGTACSSSAMVFSSAYRLLQADICDAVIVGGVDSLCGTTLHGFNSLALLSEKPCRPCDGERDGLNIGEAAGFAILQKAGNDAGIALLGFGESCDAYHVSTPHPQGDGAIKAMLQALQRANLQSQQIDYINMHGTASQVNDAVESLAISELFGEQVPCSSTKGGTGHTLGAAGIVEAIICALSLQHQFIPKSFNTQRVDEAITINVQQQTVHQTLNYVLSNSFGFGGNNCSLIFGKLTGEA